MEQDFRKVVGMDQTASSQVKTWRKSILFDVAGIVSDPKMPDFQKRIGIWKYGERIPYPAMDAFNIIENGCMVFSVDIGGHTVLFTVWLMVGEVRIGALVPLVFAQNETLRKKISRALDGQDCPRNDRIGDYYMFDWIWRDKGWSGFDFMLSSISRPIDASVLADHIASMLIHLYLSITHFLIETNNLPVVFNRIAKQGTTVWAIQERGHPEAFKDHADERGWSVTETKEEDAAGRLHTVLVPLGSVPSAGNIRTQDGLTCHIVSVEKKQDAA
ncbi:MAG: hypothetical protein BroJett012_07230 [Betaproteobacteria bacterium]|jgi:hypothetical protein|nr:hypothetical protein [Rhodocyclaceae bacterium]GIK44820.1 MAG: hypothetical protein BroJett012_07230 [Betaproteobacteria bacterium]